MPPPDMGYGKNPPMHGSSNGGYAEGGMYNHGPAPHGMGSSSEPMRKGGGRADTHAKGDRYRGKTLGQWTPEMTHERIIAVPQQFVGRVIGSRGVKLEEIQQHRNCYVRLGFCIPWGGLLFLLLSRKLIFPNFH